MDKKYRKLLGEDAITLLRRINRKILFETIKEKNINICYGCGHLIERYEDCTIEHKVSWLNLDNDGKSQELFWDLDNIAFSHHWCNTPDYITGKAKSGYRGVQKRSSGNLKRPYRAQFTGFSKTSVGHIGYYLTKKHAAIARDMGVIKTYGCGVLNFPEKLRWYKQIIRQYPNHKDWRKVLENDKEAIA